MPAGPQRWTEVTPSQFTHETEGLNLVKALLPPRDPFRAWSNFEFRDNQGRWHEVDLLVIGQRRIHLVELKYYSGTLRGDDQAWLRDGHRAEDSPLMLARRKAQRLKTKLQEGLADWAQENRTRIPDPRTAIPYIQESVFLHHPGLRCQLPQPSRLDLFGLDHHERQIGLPGISTRLLEPPAPNQSVPPHRAEIIARVVERIGVRRRQREAGSWIIDEDPLGEGDDWQDWPAFHRVATTSQARIRFLVTSPGAPAAQRTGTRRIAEHEFRVMSRLLHENLLRPIDLVENDLGIGLVYPRDERFQRLDLWLAGQPDGIAITNQLDIIRQVADALLYAHSNRVVHRCLSPHAVWVRQRDAGQEIRAIVGDWQTAGAIPVTGQNLRLGAHRRGRRGPRLRLDDRGWHLLAVLERISRTGRPSTPAHRVVGHDRQPSELLTWLQGSGRGVRESAVVTTELRCHRPARANSEHNGDAGRCRARLRRLGAQRRSGDRLAAPGWKRLVFCDSRQLVEELGAALRENGVSMFLSHASLSADERRRSEQAFAEARDCVIVATSTLELGIDVR